MLSYNVTPLLRRLAALGSRPAATPRSRRSATLRSLALCSVVLCGLALPASARELSQAAPAQPMPSPLTGPTHHTMNPAPSAAPVLSIGSITIAPQPQSQKPLVPTHRTPRRAPRPARRKLRPSDLLAPTYLLNRA